MKRLGGEFLGFFDDAHRFGELIQSDGSVGIEKEHIRTREIEKIILDPSQFMAGDVKGSNPALSVFFQFGKKRRLTLSVVFQLR
jgi:hypothetical protein